MAINKESLLRRIEQALNPGKDTGNIIQASARMHAAALSIASALFGPQSSQVEMVAGLMKDGRIPGPVMVAGALQSFRDDIDAGIVGNIQTQAQGEVYGNLVGMAKDAMDGGFKEVAAVLASASLEDSLKKLAEANGLNIDDKGIPEVISALKGARLVTGSQGKLLQGHYQTRNNAMHASWGKISMEQVGSLIGYVEHLLLEHF